jgi:hypothetical protein
MVPVLVFSAQLAVTTQSPIPAVGIIAAVTLDSLGAAAASAAAASMVAASAAASGFTFFESPHPASPPSTAEIDTT